MTVIANDNKPISNEKLVLEFNDIYKVHKQFMPKFPAVNIYQDNVISKKTGEITTINYLQYGKAIRGVEKAILKKIESLRRSYRDNETAIPGLVKLYTALKEIRVHKKHFISLGGSDRHIHTTASDGHHSPKELVDLATEKGISEIVITDHDTFDGYLQAKEYIDQLDVPLTIQPGVELSLGYNYINEDVVSYVGIHVKVIVPVNKVNWLNDLIPKIKNKNIENIAPILKKNNCEIVVAHPYRSFMGGMDDKEGFNMKKVNEMLEILIQQDLIDGIEYHYSMHSSVHREQLKEHVDHLIQENQGQLSFEYSDDSLKELEHVKAEELKLLADLYMKEYQDAYNLKTNRKKNIHYDGPNSDFHGNTNPSLDIQLGRGIVKGFEYFDIYEFSPTDIVDYHKSFKQSRETLVGERKKSIQDLLNAGIVDEEVLEEIENMIADNEFDEELYYMMREALLIYKTNNNK